MRRWQGSTCIEQSSRSPALPRGMRVRAPPLLYICPPSARRSPPPVGDALPRSLRWGEARSTSERAHRDGVPGAVGEVDNAPMRHARGARARRRLGALDEQGAGAARAGHVAEAAARVAYVRAQFWQARAAVRLQAAARRRSSQRPRLAPRRPPRSVCFLIASWARSAVEVQPSARARPPSSRRNSRPAAAAGAEAREVLQRGAKTRRSRAGVLRTPTLPTRPSGPRGDTWCGCSASLLAELRRSSTRTCGCFAPRRRQPEAWDLRRVGVQLTAGIAELDAVARRWRGYLSRRRSPHRSRTPVLSDSRHRKRT